MTEVRRRRGARRDPEEMTEEELVALLRRRSAAWLRGDRPVIEEPAPEPAPPAPPPEPEKDAPVKRKRGAKKEPAGDGGIALRKAAWRWFSARRPPSTKEEPAARKPRARRGDGGIALRKAAWRWFSARRPPSTKEEPAARKPRARRGDGGIALRKAAWRWFEARAAKLAAEAKPPAPPPPAEPVKRRRTRREGPTAAALEMRRRAWAWFAPRATGEAAAGAHLAAKPPPAEAAPGGAVRSHLKGVLEALIFASEHPLPARELARLAQADLKVVKALLAELLEEYHGRGFRLDEVAGGFVFRTSPLFAPFVREQVAKKPVKMSRAQIETLAIVAYRQPITRPEVDEVRGVDSGAVLKSLLERDLVRILGKKDEPGRPMLYGTTGSFLEFFGLKALGDLPTLREFTELTDESRRTYEREMGEDPPDGSAPLEGGLMGGEGEMRRGEEAPPKPTAAEMEDPEPFDAEAAPAAEAQGDGAPPAEAPAEAEESAVAAEGEPAPDGQAGDEDEEDEDDEDEDDEDEDDEDEDDEDEDDEDEDEDDEDEDDDE